MIKLAFYSMLFYLYKSFVLFDYPFPYWLAQFYIRYEFFKFSLSFKYICSTFFNFIFRNYKLLVIIFNLLYFS